MIGGDFILLIFLIMLNLLIMVRRIPLVGVPISIFTIYMGVAFFMNIEASVIPANPFTTFLLTIIAVSALIANGMELKK